MLIKILANEKINFYSGINNTHIHKSNMNLLKINFFLELIIQIQNSIYTASNIIK